VHIAKVGRAVKTALVSSNLPASVKKEEKATSLLSHFETKSNSLLNPNRYVPIPIRVWKDLSLTRRARI